MRHGNGSHSDGGCTNAAREGQSRKWQSRLGVMVVKIALKSDGSDGGDTDSIQADVSEVL